jgi:hypothetical protein
MWGERVVFYGGTFFGRCILCVGNVCGVRGVFRNLSSSNSQASHRPHLTAVYSTLPHYSITDMNYRWNFCHNMCVLIFPTIFCVTFPFTIKVELQLTQNIRQSLCQTAVFLVRFHRIFNFPDMFDKYSSTESWYSSRCQPSLSVVQMDRHTWRSYLSIFAIWRTK